jgi:hypothetical protein
MKCHLVHWDGRQVARKRTDIVGVTLRIREELRQRLERAANRNDTSLNAEIEARLESSFDLTNTASLIRVLVGGGFHADLLGAIARVIDGNWKEYPEKSEAAQVRREAAYVALVTIFTELLSTPEHQLDPASVRIPALHGGGEVSAGHIEGAFMASNVLNKIEHFSPMLQTTKRGLLQFPKRKKGAKGND